MEPLSQVANHSREIENNALMERPPASATYGTLTLAILILLSACLNFANTSVAQSNRRLKEMGIRKVMGRSHSQIVFQQLLECACIMFLAIVLSVVINNYWLPAFNAMIIYVNITANYFNDYILLAFLAFILISVTLLAGSYPAFYISRFNATNIFRGSVKFGGSNLFSRVLLGLQIVISFITVIAGIAFSRNSEFQRTYDFGNNKEDIIGLNLQGEASYISVRNELSKITDIGKMAGTKDQIGFSFRSVPLEARGEKKESNYLEIGDNYLDVMNLKLVAGRTFNISGIGDYGNALLINEKLAFSYGWKPGTAIGQQIKVNNTTVCTVVGVLKDFTQKTLFNSIEPVAMRLVAPENYSQIIVRSKPGSLTTVYGQIKVAWTTLHPTKPFLVYYQDEVSAEGSRENKTIATVFFWFAIISVLMAATGIFALVSLSVMKKMREIAIRKVVGASNRNIISIVIKDYLWIFIIAAGFGCYAGFSLSKLLMDLIFRINAGVSITSLTLSFVCMFIIIGITVGSRVGYALNKKVTDVLKTN